MINFKKLLNISFGMNRLDKELLNALSTKSDWYPIYINKGKSKIKKKIVVPRDNFKNALRIVLRNFQQKAESHEAVYSYQAGLSFTDLAEKHINSRYLLKMDLKAFFDSIFKEDVRQCLSRYYPSSMASKLSDFVCYEGKLPFGSPFSPYFSNIYLRRLDEQVSADCSKINAIYTRYSDDIYISSNEKASLEKIIDLVVRFLNEHYPQLSLNTSKTLIMSAPFHLGPFTVQKQYGVNLCKSYKRLIRVKLHKYSHSELHDEELPSLKGLLLFLKGNDQKYFEKLNTKFSLEIDEILSMPS